MATVSERLSERIQRLRELKQKSQEDVLRYTSKIDELKALRDAIGPVEEERLRALVESGVLKVED